MRITSNTSKPLLTGTKVSTLKLSYSAELMALTVLSLLLFCPGLTQAKDLSQTGSQIARQEVRSDQKTPIIDSTSTKSISTLASFHEDEVHCLALNIYFEARGESEIGQQAVGHVVMNRVQHGSYPDSVCKVVQQGGEQRLYRCQFSWWCDGLSDKPVNQKAWTESFQLALNIYLGFLKDTTDGALWYHATYVTPYWSKKLLQGPKIGQHIFYLENSKL